MKTVIQIVLLIVIAALVYFVVDSLMQPIRFEQKYKTRYDANVKRLKDIREAQIAFKGIHGRFTSSFDTLINFVREDSIPIVKQIGNLSDEQLEQGMTEAEAIEKGIISRDTIRVSVMDSLFGKRKRFTLDSIQYVPYTDNAKYEMKAGNVITASNIQVPVFEAKVHNDVFLKGLDRQAVVNLNDERRKLDRYPGLQVGDINEASNSAGNWE